jgi:hypothetical protein
MDTRNITGSEEGWREASGDSRRHQKQRDIKALIDRDTAMKAAAKEKWEKDFEADLVDLAEPYVRAGFERRAIGYSRRYAAQFDKVFGGT